MKLVNFALIALSALLAACATTPPEEPEVGMSFRAFAGQQKRWETTPGAVPEVINGIEIYRDGAFPPKAYEIMGRLTVIYDTRQVEQPTTQVANAARLKGADGVIVVGTDFKRATLIGYYDLFRYKR